MLLPSAGRNPKEGVEGTHLGGRGCPKSRWSASCPGSRRASPLGTACHVPGPPCPREAARLAAGGRLRSETAREASALRGPGQSATGRVLAFQAADLSLIPGTKKVPPSAARSDSEGGQSQKEAQSSKIHQWKIPNRQATSGPFSFVQGHNEPWEMGSVVIDCRSIQKLLPRGFENPLPWRC